LSQAFIAKTPLRVSFLGGGTDTKDFIDFAGNSVVFGTSINLFVYTIINEMPTFADYPYRFTYRIVENVFDPSKIQHPLVRETLMEKSWQTPINIATLSDVPGNSGLGSSSAFAISFNHALLAFQGDPISSNLELARHAIRLEREILSEPGGIQDQYHCAIGGLRFYNFKKLETEFSEDFSASSFGRLLNERLYLIWSGNERSQEYPHPTVNRQGLNSFKTELRQIAVDFISKFNSKSAEPSYALLIECLNASWNLKREIIREDGLDSAVKMVQTLLHMGADAAKVCGAGGGGFVLALASQNNWGQKIREVIGEGKIFKVQTDSQGSRVNRI